MNLEYVDRHDAKIRSITMEAPEGYEFGHVVKAEIELRVAKLEYETDKEGNLIRTAVMMVDSCHIKEAFDPSKDLATVTGSASASAQDDEGDDIDPTEGTVVEDDGVPRASDGSLVDEVTGEVLRPESELVGAGVGSGDLDVGF